MPTTVTRRPAIRSLDGWATAILREAGAIVECEEHGWIRERGDPDALAHALATACNAPPQGFCTSEAVAAIKEVIASIGDTCPDCSPQGQPEESPRFK